MDGSGATLPDRGDFNVVDVPVVVEGSRDAIVVEDVIVDGDVVDDDVSAEATPGATTAATINNTATPHMPRRAANQRRRTR